MNCRNAFADNIVAAAHQTLETSHRVTNTSSGLVMTTERHYVRQMNVLGIIVFSITCGVVISRLGEVAKPLSDFFIALDAVITAIVNIIFWFAPIGIASVSSRHFKISMRLLLLAHSGQNSRDSGSNGVSVRLWP